MDKSLEDKNKKDQGAPSAGKTETPPPALDLKGEGLGAYGRNSSYQPELNQKLWDNSKLPWNETMGGRLAIRAFSRGVMGAAFFAAGNLLATKWMNGDVRYDPTKPFSEQMSLAKGGNPLKVIAKCIDTVAGKPIEWVTTQVTGDPIKGLEMVHFRPTNPAYMGANALSKVPGRSLGHEAVGITFDFFCASVGDAWGRDIAGWVDPHVKKEWIKDGKIDFPAAVKQMCKSTAQYLTYNGGEDWAVAIPYAYYMKAQRAAIGHPKISPGFEKDFDLSKNGSVFKRDKHGHVTGNYSLEGSVDLQGRFTVYNMGTLMYREVYDHLVNWLVKGKKTRLYGAPDSDEKRSVLGWLGDHAKWVARSVIKGGIYMTPAVPFFWPTRAVQWRDQKLAVNPGNPAEPVSHIDERANPGFQEHGSGVNLIDKAYDTVGRASQHLVDFVDRHADRLDERGGKYVMGFKQRLGIHELNQFSNVYTKAAISYTPYMYAKAEAARLWDHGKMDLSLERMIDGAAKLDLAEFKAGVGEVYRSFVHQPLKDPAREAEAQKRILLDTSLPADVNLGGDPSRRKLKAAREQQAAKDQLDWRQRVVQGKAEEKQEKKSPELSPKAASYVDQEDLRKTLNELTPPTNSIH
jgi:hypothetical protein